MTQPQAETGLKERFFKHFQHEVSALQEQIDRLADTASSGGERADAVDHCLAGISRLSSEVKNASGYIPAYDQRMYSEAIKALSEKLQEARSTLAPKSKFSFKTSRKNASAISLTDAAEIAAAQRMRLPGNHRSDPSSTESSVAPTPLYVPTPPNEPNTDAVNQGSRPDSHTSAIRKPSFSSSTSITLSHHTNAHIILPPTASHATSSGSLTSLRHCIVDMFQPTASSSNANSQPFASLTLKHISESLLVCGRVSGPAHVTGVQNSVLVVACAQFRMHDCKDVDVYLACSSRPIIEGCEGIRFSPLPEAYSHPSDSESTAPQNLWDQIDDFNWIKPTPSPHFAILPPEKRIPEAVWRDVVPGSLAYTLEGILKLTVLGRS
ncbi:MAG: hypothetical protein M1819_000591 [Sarea resinae]|nr:MAG: hypothetical protein M1819_000591 [Sarea resinae]